MIKLFFFRKNCIGEKFFKRKPFPLDKLFTLKEIGRCDLSKIEAHGFIERDSVSSESIGFCQIGLREIADHLHLGFFMKFPLGSFLGRLPIFGMPFRKTPVPSIQMLNKEHFPIIFTIG